jgi:hypothetical protein
MTSKRRGGRPWNGGVVRSTHHKETSLLTHPSPRKLKTSGIMVEAINPNHSETVVEARALTQNHSETVLEAAPR